MSAHAPAQAMGSRNKRPTSSPPPTTHPREHSSVPKRLKTDTSPSKVTDFLATDNGGHASSSKLDHSAFPHIMDLILQHPSAWLPMRLTCTTYCSKVEALMYRHIIIRGYQSADDSEYSDCDTIFPSRPKTTIRVLSPHLTDLPGFRSDLEDTHRSRGRRQYFGRHLKHTKVVDLPFGISQDKIRRVLARRLKVQMVRLYWDPQFSYLPNSLNIIRPSTLVFMHPGYLDIAYNRGTRAMPMVLPRAAQRVIINGMYSWRTGPDFYFWPLLDKDDDRYTQHFIFILHPWPPSTSSFAEPKRKPGQNQARWKEFIVIIMQLLVRSKNREPYIAFVDTPTAPWGHPKDPPFQSFSHQLLAALGAVLTGSGCSAPQIKDHLAKIEFISKEEHANRIPRDQFLLEYAPPHHVLRR